MEARAQIKSNLDKDLEDEEATDLENNNDFFITEPVSTYIEDLYSAYKKYDVIQYK